MTPGQQPVHPALQADARPRKIACSAEVQLCAEIMPRLVETYLSVRDACGGVFDNALVVSVPASLLVKLACAQRTADRALGLAAISSHNSAALTRPAPSSHARHPRRKTYVSANSYLAALSCAWTDRRRQSHRDGVARLASVISPPCGSLMPGAVRLEHVLRRVRGSHQSSHFPSAGCPEQVYGACGRSLDQPT